MSNVGVLNRFLGSFVQPMANGGAVHVRGLLGPGILAEFNDLRPANATIVTTLADVLRHALARVGPAGAMVLIPADALGLAAVWHNLLAMTHPDVKDRRRLRRRVRVWSEVMLQRIGSPRTAASVAVRHAAIARLAEIGRVDTDVSFWAGSARYVGVPPPKRLLRWRSVRRVRENRTRVGLPDLLATLRATAPTEDLFEIAERALRLSPLTDLMLSARGDAMPFAWAPFAVNALADDSLRGAAIRMVLDPGARATLLPNDSPAARIHAIEAATQSAVDSGVPARAAQALARLHVELLLTDAIGRTAPPPGHLLAWDCVARLGAERIGSLVGLSERSIREFLNLEVRTPTPASAAPSRALLLRAGLLEVPS